MSKNTNKTQLQHLLALMEANPDIACSSFKGRKEALTRFWENAEFALNAMGPPTKCVAEWKKVWIDQKRYVRLKAAQNLKELKFSPIEEAIYNLVGMFPSVGGGSAKSSGRRSPTKVEYIAEPLQNVNCEDDVEFIIEETYYDSENAEFSTVTPTKHIKENIIRENDVPKTTFEALQAELTVQKELLQTIKLVAENQREQEQSTRRIYKSLDKLNDLQQKHCKEMERMKREEIQEIKRHNAFIEELRIREMEYKLEQFW